MQQKNPSGHVFNRLDTRWARAAFTLWVCWWEDVLANRNMQTGCRDTTTGYCQFGGGSGTGWDQCHQSQMKSTEMRGFFLKNRENWEGIEDITVLVNRAISIQMVGHVISWSLSSTKESVLQFSLCNHSISDVSSKLLHHFCQIWAKTEWVTRYSGFPHTHNSFLQVVCYDGLGRFISLGHQFSIHPRKWKSVSPLYFFPFFVSAR